MGISKLLRDLFDCNATCDFKSFVLWLWLCVAFRRDFWKSTVRSRQGILSHELRWPSPTKVVAPAPPIQQGWPRLLAAAGGLPRVIGAKNPKDEVVQLLRIAAEIEHSLMVQYLYAAFLLGPGADQKYHQYLITIAKQEMGHLVTVQNLLRLLSEPPHLDRDALLPGSGKEPDPFVLEPVTPESLAKYVVIESPFDEVIKTIPEDWPIYQRATGRIDPKALTRLNRVGVLYAAIYWLFMKTDQIGAVDDDPWQLDVNAILATDPSLKGFHLKDDDFSLPQGLPALIATQDEWHVNVDSIYVEQSLDRNSAKLAVFKIASQGEGVSNDPTSMSHFQRFLALFAAAEKVQPDIIHVAVTKANLVATEAGQSIAKCFNTRYQILLLLIDLALRTPRGDDDNRATICTLAIQEMLMGVGGVAGGMLGLVDGPSNGPVAPPFELPSGAWPANSLPDAATTTKRLRLLLNQSSKIDETIRKNWPGFMQDQLDPLKGLDAQIKDMVDKLPL
jgi:rubrerythrin